MPLQNRVTPTGQIVASSARGTWMGNRGILHNSDRTLGSARWRHKAWIICKLNFKDRHSDVMPKRGYTRLFFLDEAVAFSAGHRPCAECRRHAYNSFKSLWLSNNRITACSAADIDHQLHKERVDRTTQQQITSQLPLGPLPNGAFIQMPDQYSPLLVYEDALFPFREIGYGEPINRPKTGRVAVLTPPSLIKILQSGYQIDLHCSLPDPGIQKPMH